MPVRVTTERPEVRRRNPLWWAVAAVAGVLLISAAFLVGRQTSPTPAPAATARSPAPSASPSATEPSGAAGDLTPVQGTVMVDGQPVEGLYIGTATVAQGARSSIYGIPFGWERTLEGAVGAAMTTEAAWYSLPNLVEETALQLSSHLYTGTAYEARQSVEGTDLRRQMREALRLSEDGVVVTDNGLPSPEETYYGGGVPEYGAYKILDIKEEGGELISVTVATFLPIYAGAGTETNLEEVRVGFDEEESLMVWDAADETWKLEEWVGDGVDPVKVEFTNQGYRYLRDQLGPGWAVPADATQDPFAGAVKTR